MEDNRVTKRSHFTWQIYMLTQYKNNYQLYEEVRTQIEL